MKPSFFLGIDQGTTGTTVVVTAFTPSDPPRHIGRATVEFAQHFPQIGWVEHDLDSIWDSVRTAWTQALANAMLTGPGFKPQQLAGIGITNQRETLCAFARKTGDPL